MSRAALFLARSFSQLSRSIGARRDTHGARSGAPPRPAPFVAPRSCPFEGLSITEQEFFGRCDEEDALAAAE